MKAKEAYSTAEFAELVGISKERVSELIREKKIRAVNISRGNQRARFRIHKDEIERFFDRNANEVVGSSESKPDSASRIPLASSA